MRRDSALVAGIAGKSERRIRQQKDKAAMGDTVAVDHIRLDRHGQRGFARLDLQDLHAETLAGVVFVPHCVGAGAREIIRRERGLDVHGRRPAGINGRLPIRVGYKTLLPYRRAC